MQYKGYDIVENGSGITVRNVRDFHPVHIFECGQCFRWTRQEDGSHTGIVRGRVANIAYRDNELVIANATREDFINLWFDYLDLGTDYAAIKEQLRKDKIMEQAIAFGHGIRILHQEIWETLVSFIISANNQIPRIIKIVSALSGLYGEMVDINGTQYYAFPGAGRLLESTLEELEACRGGFRCKYIMETAKMVSRGEINLDALSSMKTGDARNELMRLPGVGPKVADCVLLYSGTKTDVFPTDVWVKRVMEELYFHRKASFKEIQQFAADYFGNLAGYAQQYLFYYARENKIGTK